MPTQGGTVRWIIEADDSQFNQTLDNVEKRAETTVRVLKKNDIGSSFWSSISRGAKDTASVMGELGNSIASLGWEGAKIGATALSTALVGLTSKGIEGADALAKYNAQIVGLAKSTADANSAMSTAVDFFKNNPFQRFETIEAVKNLMQYDKSIANANTNSGRLRQTLDMLGVASLSTGTSIAELASQWGEISNTSTVSIGQLDEFANRVPAIWDAIGKRVGKRAAEVREAYLGVGVAGKVVRQAMQDLYGLDTKKLNGSKEQVEEYLNSLSGAARQSAEAYVAFGNTMARQTDRVKGRLADMQAALAGYTISVDGGFQAIEGGMYQAVINLKKAFADALASSSDTGKLMAQSLGKIGAAIAPFINKLAEKLPDILEKIFTYVDKFGDILQKNKAILVPILGAVLAFIGKLGISTPVIGPLLEVISNKTTKLWKSLASLVKLHPLLSVFLAIFGTGLVAAFKNSEEFRASVSKLFTSLGKLIQNLMPVFQTFIKIFTEIATSDAVLGILQTLANVLSGVAEALSNIPVEVLTSLVTALLMFKLLDTNPIVGYTVAILGLIEVVKQIGPSVLASIKSWLTGIGTAFKNAAKGLVTAGHNLMIGLQNGINEGAKKVFEYIREVASVIVVTFKKSLGIHSPSKVMAEQGKNVTLGLAQGITDSKSVVQKAMDMLASDILKSIEKVVSNKVDFGLLDYAGQYKEWKKISKMFTVGSQQYQTAIEKMEEARKQANLQILSLQKTYNDTLDNTIEKVSKMYGLFDKVNTSGGKSANDIISDLDQQVAALQNFASSKEMINALDLDKGLIDELQSMGIDSAQELSTIAQMTTDELAKLNDLWLKKQEQANRAGVAEVKNLKDKTLDEVSKIKEGIDGETISLTDAGGRLVESISEGVYGAMPTLGEAFSKMDEYMAKAAREIGGKGGAGGGGDIPEAIGNNLGNALNGAGDKIKETAEKLGQDLMKYVGIGLVGGIALKLVMTGLTSFLTKKVFNKGTTDLIANQLVSANAGKVADVGKLSSAASKSGKMTTSVNQISSNTTAMSPGMQKVSQVENLIIKGALAIVAIAGAIAAMAGALWVAHQLLGKIDLGRLAVELVLIAGVTAGMGVIAYAIGKVDLLTMGKGLLVIVGVAGTLALVGLALGVVDKSITSDFGVLAQKIGAMALAIVAMGVLAAAIGAIMATGVAALVVGAGLVAMLAIAGAYALIALELKAIQSIELDEAAVVSKVNLIKEILDKIGPKGGVLDNIKDTVKLFLEVIKTVELGAIVALYKGIAENLNYIQNVKLNPDAIITKVTLIKDVINKIGNTGEGSITSQIRSVVATFLDLIKTVQVSLIVDTYAGMAENLEKIQNIEINKEEIVKKVQLLGEICDTVAKPTLLNGQDMWSALNDAVKMMLQAKATESAAKILGVYSDIGDTLGKIEKIDENCKYDSVQRAVSEVGKVVQLVIDMKGDGGILGNIGNFFTGNPITEEQVQKVVNILRKLGDIGSTINAIPGVYTDGAKEKIEAMKNVINKVGEIKDPGDLGTKEWIVGMVTSIIYKLGEMESALRSLKGEDKTGVVKTLLNTMNTLLTGVVNNLQAKLGDLETLGKNMVIRFKAGLDSQKDGVVKSGADLQGALWNAIEKKMSDEYYQGRALANKIKEGVQSVSLVLAGQNAVQGFINGANSKNVYSTGWQIADRFLKGLKDRGKEGSPWATTFESGAWAGLGLAEGIASSEALVVGEAYSLADQVIDALSMDDVSVSPSFNPTVGGSVPLMDMEGGYYGNKRPVEINQTNNNYTNYSMQALNRDLAWEISKI